MVSSYKLVSVFLTFLFAHFGFFSQIGGQASSETLTENHFNRVQSDWDLPGLASSVHEMKKDVQNETVFICVSKTSHRYHNSMCKGMKSCTHEKRRVPLNEAINMGKTPCSFFYKRFDE
jgi:hypothetical protein